MARLWRTIRKLSNLFYSFISVKFWAFWSLKYESCNWLGFPSYLILGSSKSNLELIIFIGFYDLMFTFPWSYIYKNRKVLLFFLRKGVTWDNSDYESSRYTEESGSLSCYFYIFSLGFLWVSNMVTVCQRGFSGQALGLKPAGIFQSLSTTWEKEICRVWGPLVWR